MTLTNPITGDTMTVLQKAAQSPTQTLRLQFVLAPNAAGSPPHIHPRITETFTVEKGTLAVRLGKDSPRLLTAGESVTIPPGTLHRFWNPTEQYTQIITEVTPGHGFERFMRSLYGLAIDGKTDRRGMPTSVLIWACLWLWADFRLPVIPQQLQETIFVALYQYAERQGIVDDLAAYWSERAITVPAENYPPAAKTKLAAGR
ncbi:MAG: cupin domain-containing protein [Armatimonas sp.]